MALTEKIAKLSGDQDFCFLGRDFSIFNNFKSSLTVTFEVKSM